MSDQRPPVPGSGPPDEGDTDPWGWLYRREAPASADPAGSADPTGSADRAESRAPDQGAAPGPAPATPREPELPEYGRSRPAAGAPTPVSADDVRTEHVPAAAVPVGELADEPQSQTREYHPGYLAEADPRTAAAQRRRDHRSSARALIGLIIAAVCLVAIVAVVLVVVSRHVKPIATPPPPATSSTTSASPSTVTSPTSSQSASPSTSASPSASTSSSASASASVYTGAVTPLHAAGAQADCVAPDGRDVAGKPVPYGADLVTDGDPSTAWRCDGNGAGKKITVSLPAGSTVARLGLINGYAKTDPSDHTDRYPEYRRITKVRWTLSTGASFDQDLTDKTKTLQWLKIPETTGVNAVSVTILDSTSPGGSDSSRDAVLISEIVAA